MATLKLLLLLCFIVAYIRGDTNEDKKYWREVGDRELKDALKYTWNTNTAKNVIVFVGDGMSPDTITASRIYRAGENSYLSWERFPHIGLLKTYNNDKQAPDSASTATALFGGVKTNYNLIGVDGNVKLDDCNASLVADNRVDSIISWAQAAGKSTGFVTTTRVTHATPGPLYASSANRKWECEACGKMPKNSKCKDIGRQLVENEPGKNIKVIMGGGRQMLRTDVSSTENDPLDMWAGRRADGRDLISAWEEDKKAKQAAYKVVENNHQLSQVDFDKVDYLLGIFANGHVSMDYKRDKGPKGMPSLADMTVAALKVLKKNERGFLLVVEGGLIDFAHHRGHAAQALLETVRLSEAINATLDMVDTEDTLVIVTSDHTHSLSFNGNSDRGANILGIADVSKIEGIPYTTLSYGTGGPNNRAYETYQDGKETKMRRIDPTTSDTTDFEYSQQAAFVTDEAHHGGGDVAVYAIGPYAHLFHTTHEQNFVAYVVAYAAKIGPYNHSSSIYSSNQWGLVLIGNLLALLLTSYSYYHL
ncbi:alkaline phosphatase, tissue-nonspecific isozyme [Trichogramma pretiosum]|uniref:alkaline phosphatase, tissue-nonspecific isozyme n=1 Tax=Trichogramma pretiosum TaxID=7493 RepID=UPI0006C94C5A|nr:alkaline phosphatase, tissue-nonspecific isozyme [Trichogramma pretiosum]